MKVEVLTPEENMGDVIGDLNSRRGVISGMEDGPAGKVVKAQVPLAEMFGYATDLRGATQVEQVTAWNLKSTKRYLRRLQTQSSTDSKRKK